MGNIYRRCKHLNAYRENADLSGRTGVRVLLDDVDVTEKELVEVCLNCPEKYCILDTRRKTDGLL